MIRLAAPEEWQNIDAVYENARRFMRQTGNATQWSSGEPTPQQIKEDIAMRRLYVLEEQQHIDGVFYFHIGPEPLYDDMTEGAWLNDRPYAVLHRVAVAQQGKGTVGKIFAWAFSQYPNLKMDTHRDNLPMRRALEKHGFQFCGTVLLKNGQQRMTFQKIT